MSPALAGGFLTSGPPGKSLCILNNGHNNKVVRIEKYLNQYLAHGKYYRAGEGRACL